MIRFVPIVPVQLLLQAGAASDEALRIHQTVEMFNAKCNRGFDIMGGGTTELPLFSTHEQLMGLLRDGMPLILRREVHQ